MEHKFSGTIPWVAFSQFEYKGDPAWFVKFLKELEAELPNIPWVFGVNPQNKEDVISRLEKANKVMISLQKEDPSITGKIKVISESL